MSDGKYLAVNRILNTELNIDSNDLDDKVNLTGWKIKSALDSAYEEGANNPNSCWHNGEFITSVLGIIFFCLIIIGLFLAPIFLRS